MIDEELFAKMCSDAEFEKQRRELQDKVDQLRREIKEKGFKLWVALSDEYGGLQGGEVISGDRIEVSK